MIYEAYSSTLYAISLDLGCIFHHRVRNQHHAIVTSRLMTYYPGVVLGNECWLDDALNCDPFVRSGFLFEGLPYRPIM